VNPEKEGYAKGGLLYSEEGGVGEGGRQNALEGEGLKKKKVGESWLFPSRGWRKACSGTAEKKEGFTEVRKRLPSFLGGRRAKTKARNLQQMKKSRKKGTRGGLCDPGEGAFCAKILSLLNEGSGFSGPGVLGQREGKESQENPLQNKKRSVQERTT